MNLSKKTLIQLCCIILFAFQLEAVSPSISIDSQEPTLHVDFDACVSYLGGSNSDYSEFSAWETQYESCARIEMAGPGHVYRENSLVNTHSCTPGIDSSSIGMCITSLDSCSYFAESDKALKFDIRVIPGEAGLGNIGELSFYEQAPEEFNFYQGQTGPNNYPLYIGVRVLVDGQEIFRDDSIETARTWQLMSFDFSENEAFTVFDTTIFQFEILPYCPVGNGAFVSAWDIDELNISGSCNNLSAGFLKVIGNVNSCVDTVDKIIQFEAEDAFGPNMSFIITDDEGVIISIPEVDSIDLDTFPNGVFSVYHLVYDDNFQGLSLGFDIDEFEGCFDLSSEVVVTHNDLEAGMLIGVDSLTSYMICSDDALDNQVGVFVVGGAAMFIDFLVLDDSLNILDVQPGSLFDFRTYSDGTYSIVAVGHNGDLMNAVPGMSFNDLEGCFVSSNFYTVIKDTSVSSGVIDLDEDYFCVGDGNPDLLMATVSGAGGAFQRFIITDADSTILSSPDSLPVDLDLAPVGVCLLWHVSSLDTVEIIPTEHISTLMGTCIDLSTPVPFERVQNSAGLVSLVDSSFIVTVCVIDSLSEPQVFTNSSNPADTFQYVITDSLNVIIGFSASDTISFAGAESGTCLVWGFAHDGSVDLQMGDFLSDSLIMGLCADISSNFVEIIRVDSGIACGESDCDVSAGTVDLFANSFCVGDGEPDIVTGDVLGANGAFMQLLLTDSDSMIIALPDSLSFDVDGAEPGVCIVWNLVSDDSIAIDTGMFISAIQAECFDLSAGASFTRIENFGGMVSLMNGMTSIEVCVQDSIQDSLSFITTGVGMEYEYIVTDTSNVIISIADSNVIDFEGAEPGTCLVWGMAHNDSIPLMEGDTLIEPEVMGSCFDLSSNFVEVIRHDSTGVCDEIECDVSAGMIDLFANSFCVGDGEPDIVTGDVLGASGSFMQLLLTDSDSMIIALPDSLSFDVDGAEPGVCIVWNLVSDDSIAIDTGMFISAIQAECFDLSAGASFTRIENFGGMVSLMNGMTSIEVCVQDSIPDSLSFITTGVGMEYEFIVTDTSNVIISIADSNVIDFEGAEPGTCLVWGMAHNDSIPLMEGDTLIEPEVMGSCFDLSSNFVEVIRIDSGGICEQIMCDVDGGIVDLFGSNYCVGDGISDLLDGDILGADGDQMQLLLTDSDSIVLMAIDSLPYDVDGLDAGECLLWNVASTDTISIDTGMHIAAIQSECFDLSNAASFTKTFVDGAMVNLINGDTTVTVCVGDGSPDLLEFLNNSSSSENYQYVITDSLNVISALVDSTGYDFDTTEVGVCRVYGVSYSGAFLPMLGDTLMNDPAPNECFDISDNFIEVIKVDSGPLCDTMMMVTNTIVLNRVSSVSVIFDIKNISQDTIDVTDYWICRGPGMYDRIGDVIIECGTFNLLMAPGDILGLNLGVSNVDGELGIYTTDEFTDPDAIIHYVEWGSSGHPRSSVAVAAGLWTTDDFVPSFDAMNSIYYDGDGISSSDWDEGPSNLCGELPTQVVFNRVSDVDMVVDVKNISMDTVDINDFYIGQNTDLHRIGDLSVDCGPASRILAPDEIIGLVVDPIANADGELAMYRSQANTVFGVVADYVQWGSAGHQREQSAVFSGVWTQDDFVASISAGQSIYYDGDGDSSTDWSEDDTDMCMDSNFNGGTNEIQFSIAPNPATDNVVVQIEQTNRVVNQIVISDMNGKIIYSEQLQLSRGDSHEIEINGISQGIYFMNLRSQNATKTKKLIISN